jgi:O-antigen/teichoic acid export membrane protein
VDGGQPDQRSLVGEPSRSDRLKQTRGVRVVGRAGWAVIDQGFVSLANFALGIVVARLVTATEFGAFGLAFAIYLMALAVSRAFATQPLAIRFGARDEGEFRRGAAQATGVAVVIGLVFAASILMIALVLGGIQGQVLIALAIVLPGLLVQDAWRFTMFTSRRGRVAVINDLIATSVMAGLIVLVVTTGVETVSVVMLCWGAGAAVAALAGIYQAQVWPQPAGAIRWFREHWDITPAFFGSELLEAIGAQAFLFMLGAIAGLAAVGSVRGAQLLVGPVYIMSAGVNLSLVPEMSRQTGSMSRFRRLSLLLSGSLAVIGITWGIALLLLPDSIGGQLLGETWPGARSVLLPISLSIIIPLISIGPRIGLRVLEDTSGTLRVSVMQAGLTIGGGVLGALAGGVTGAAWGLAAGFSLAAILWWIQFSSTTRRRARSRPGDD